MPGREDELKELQQLVNRHFQSGFYFETRLSPGRHAFLFSDDNLMGEGSPSSHKIPRYARDDDNGKAQNIYLKVF
ncbi:hypothetical protein [Coxiella-like endosymbiont of Rhipicephalus sanguineus]|uniref:hypothetical protein n=1 Tax=Coxiella-like endosymbiont of Rhipicephalus sanguineus TaxID=1955402 RepID=UPI002041C96A|nr:hypothetical protein [Coxiella-like endosymbiont of Rhipicephalus sanguineus]